jgi:hypothetical protein
MRRRDFLKVVSGLAVLWSSKPRLLLANRPSRVNFLSSSIKDPLATIYKSENGSPEENLKKVLEMMGGLEKLIETDAVLIIKPNVQWWNQGAPNLAALKAFVDQTMNRPGGFKGQVVIAENCHRGQVPWKSLASGWAPVFERNSDVPKIRNMGELCAQLKLAYGSRFSVVHWVDVASGGKRVFSPKDGEGYVYCDGTGGVPLLKCENGEQGLSSRSTIMTYPLFRTDRGTMVDFKNGVWEKGGYTDQPLRLVLFSALNHHSSYAGMTSAVKNYMGITDLSGGPDPVQGGKLTGAYYNFHSFPFNKWASGPQPGMLGKEMGVFMKTIRKADMHFTTAEWIGLSSRTDPPVARTRTILASTDSVALDYHGAKYVLYPNSKVALHNPDNLQSPLRQYLAKCAEAGGCILDESRIEVKSFDFKSQSPKKDWLIKGEIEWGSNIKQIMKYLYFREIL